MSMSRTRSLLLILGLGIAFFLAGVDFTALNLALNSIQGDLGITLVTMQWVLNGYLIAFSSLLIAAGRIGDIMGHRRIFSLGLFFFALASIGGSFSQGGWEIILARVCQGLGAAFFWPGITAIAIQAFGKKRYPVISNILIGFLGLGLAGGPLFGGILLHYLNWRWIFFLNAPLAFISLAIILPVTRHFDREKQNKKIDLLGALLLTIASFSAVYFIDRIGTRGASDPFVWILGGLFFLALICFYLREKRAIEPLIDLKLIKNSYFISNLVSRCTSMFPYFTMLFFLAYLLLHVVGKPPLTSGLYFLPLMVPIAFIPPYLGFALMRFGTHRTHALGVLLLISGLLWLSFTSFSQIDFWGLFGPLLLFGIGLGFFIPATNNGIIQAMPANYSGFAMGLLFALITFSASVSISISGVFMQTLAKSNIERHIELLGIPLTPIQKKAIPKVTSGEITVEQAASLFPQNVPKVRSLIEKGFERALHWNLILGVVLIISTTLIFAKWLYSKNNGIDQERSE